MVAARKKFPWIKILFVAIFFLGLFYLAKRETRFWNGSDKLTLAINKGQEGVWVANFDPRAGAITTLIIPGDTQVEVAKNLGVWRLKSIWELGMNEKLGGSLLAKTITKNFDFPTFAWADAGASGFIGGDIKSLISAFSSFYKTNLGMGDRLALVIFAARVKNINKSFVDLRETPILKKSTLKDGEEGYVVSPTLGGRIAAIFSDSEVGSLNLKTLIRDGSEDSSLSQKVGEIIEVLGPKVALITKEKETTVDVCEVSSKFKDFAVRIARIFDCRVSKLSSRGNFDVEVTLGKNFAREF